MESRFATNTSELPCALCGQSSLRCDGEGIENCQGIVYLGNVFGATPLYFGAAPLRSTDLASIGRDQGIGTLMHDVFESNPGDREDGDVLVSPGADSAGDGDDGPQDQPLESVED